MTDVFYSIMNSLVIVLFLSGMVAMIMLRTLHKDIARYNQVDQVKMGAISGLLPLFPASNNAMWLTGIARSNSNGNKLQTDTCLLVAKHKILSISNNIPKELEALS